MIESRSAVNSLQALAHEARLAVFLALVEAGPEGRPAGALAEQLGMAPNALSFHLARLRRAGLVHTRREGQRVMYSACFEQVEGLVGFLADRCCRASASSCGPSCRGRAGTLDADGGRGADRAAQAGGAGHARGTKRRAAR